jgi:hypothetical protein
MSFAERIFRGRAPKSQLSKLQILSSEISDSLRKSDTITARSEPKLRQLGNKVEREALPISRGLLEIGRQIQALMRSIVTSFTKITTNKDLTVRQLNAYRTMFSGNKEGLNQVIAKSHKAENDLLGAYAVLEEIEDKMKELKRNTESALKADQKMYGAIRPINKILTELALRISGDK